MRRPTYTVYVISAEANDGSWAEIRNVFSTDSEDEAMEYAAQFPRADVKAGATLIYERRTQ